MCKFIKQLFCKHDWVIINAETPIENRVVDTNNGKLLQYRCNIGVQVFCVKCDKIEKRISKFLTRIKMKEIKQRITENAEEYVKTITEK